MRAIRPGRLLRTLLLAGIVVLALAGAAGGWLTSSESGLQASARLLARLSHGDVLIDQARGRLLGPLSFATLRVKTTDLELLAEDIHIEWTPAALLEGRVQIARLQAGSVRLTLAADQPPSPPPGELRLPLAIDVQQVDISSFEYASIFSASTISGRLSSNGQQHRLDKFEARSGSIVVHGDAVMDASAPLTIKAKAEISGNIDDHALAVGVEAQGPLERIELAIVARQGMQGQAQLVLTPFAAAAFSSARIALDNIDPAAWKSGAPAARLSLRSELAPKGTGVSGAFVVTNHQPGPLDRQRLPIVSLTGKIDWQASAAVLNELRVKLPDQGELAGQGQWRDGALLLDLDVRRVNAAKLYSSLHASGLNGSISTRIDANRQSARIKLQDKQFQILAEGVRDAERLTVSRLEIGSGTARLSATGSLALDKGMGFAAEGELKNFDPSRFAKTPPALLNAHFKAKGTMQPRLIVSGQFELQQSRLAGYPFSGRGSLAVDWPRIPQADIEISAGPNRLTAHGAFGQANDSLLVEIDAPQLSPYGLEGGLKGRLEVAGGVQQARLAGSLTATGLGLPGVGRVSGLTLTGQAGSDAASPLLVDLVIARVDTPEQAGLAKALHVHIEGSNQVHRLSGRVELAAGYRLALAADGGVIASATPGARPSWRGQLQELSLLGAETGSARQLKLLSPAPLTLGLERWSLGPAQLAGEPLAWRATLQAEASAQRLLASLSAQGERLGRIEGQASAGLRGAWSLDAQAPWQASLKTDIADLGWISGLIGESWQSQGRFSGELKIAGTPERPLASGQFRGQQLALRLPEQGLNLANGELNIELDNKRLRVRQLGFDSILQAMPQALSRATGTASRALTEKPGRLEVSGEMQIDPGRGAESAALDVHLERFGAWQLPDQWLLVSGNGRLAWRDGALAIRGQLSADAGYWQLAPAGAPRLSDDVVIKRPGSEKPVPGVRPELDLDITTDLGQALYFSGAGLQSRLLGAVRLRASGRDLPRASGTIRAVDGRYQAYGQQLSITRGILSFQGLLDNPALDIRAVRLGLPVEPGVQIGGSAQKPVVRLISDPELAEAEKLSWLVLGHGPEQVGSGDAATLLSAASSLLGNNAGGVVQDLKKTFGIDELGVRQGQIGDSGRRQSSRVVGAGVDAAGASGEQIFTAGKRLSSNVLLSYEQALGKAESIVKLTVNLSQQVSLIARAGSDNALDIFYTLSFGGTPRKAQASTQKNGAEK